jgi:hypothetical protein
VAPPRRLARVGRSGAPATDRGCAEGMCLRRDGRRLTACSNTSRALLRLLPAQSRLSKLRPVSRPHSRRPQVRDCGPAGGTSLARRSRRQPSPRQNNHSSWSHARARQFCQGGQRQGVAILKVDPDGLAAEKGLTPGEVILSVATSPSVHPDVHNAIAQPKRPASTMC